MTIKTLDDLRALAAEAEEENPLNEPTTPSRNTKRN